VENAQRRGKSYPPEVAEQIVRRSKELFFEQGKDIPSFAEATLKAARIPYQPSRGHTIFFYGPDRTFPHISLRDVLDPETWNQHLQQETFRNKIVLIGPTAKVYQDLHATPFSKTFPYTTPMAGVEVNANAIATLLENKSIAEAIPNPSWRGATVLVIVPGFCPPLSETTSAFPAAVYSGCRNCASGDCRGDRPCLGRN
jgi:CHASE2 domain-containing sensor protein